MQELIFVEFTVRQEGKDLDEEPIGRYCVPLGRLNRGVYLICDESNEIDSRAFFTDLPSNIGFRHLPLHDAQLNQHLFSTLFVQINIRDV